ncbi:4Fe-4S dicluster domain-containing protein [Candidatus Thorarchaeota archaeon]|nr:MAG: 4Fe-4S dicluster domain-containing protein [Candidatus Thorarchaeota archaeon]
MPADYNSTVEEIQRVLKEKTKRFAFKKLEREVITTGACVECGSCVEGCPVGAISGSRIDNKYVPILTGECTSCGICYAMCPRAFSIEDNLIGNVKSAWKVRSLRNYRRQDGGAVTAFLEYMLENKLIEAAVIACQTPDIPWLPIAKRVTSKEELHDCGGTIYTHAPVVSEMIKGFKEGLFKQAIVGTACNIDAIERMESHQAGFFSVNTDASIFKISLFCMESFNYADLLKFLKGEEIQIKDVKRFAISGGQFTVTMDTDEKSWPVKDLDSAAATSCAYCQDLTGLNSDISCGNIGSDDGWTTVLVRTVRGEKVLQGALKAGIIEAEELESKSVSAVANSARFKKNKFYSLIAPH